MAADLPGPEDIPLDPDLLKTLASDSRRDILRLLKQRRMTLTELATALNLGKATVLEHLKKLQDSGLIARREDERLWVYYDLTPRGKRVVSPGRTRFYIVMGLTAAGALMVGVLLTLALTHSAPQGFPAGEPALKGTQAVEAQGTLVAWRGLDPGVSLRLSQGGRATPGTVFLDGSAPLQTDPSGAVLLDASGLDALPVGNHTLTFLPVNGTAREPVAGFLDVRDPQPALSPLQVPAGRASTVVLAFADPAAPVPSSVSVDGQPLAAQPIPGGATVTLRAAAPGSLSVQVGRLAPIAVEAVPDLALTFTPDGAGDLALRVAAPDGSPAAGMQATLDGAPLGTTDANGTLLFPAPEPGVRALRLSGAGGESTRALVFQGWNVSEASPQVALTRASQGSFSAAVRNDGPAPLPLTVAAVVDGRLAAAQPVDVPANGSVVVRLDPRLQGAGHSAALEARATLLTPVRFVNGSTSSEGSTPAPATATPVAASPTTMPPLADSSGDAFYGYEQGDSRIVARLDLGALAVTTPAMSAPGSFTATPSPKVPGPEVALVLAAGVALAALLRRRR